MEGGGYGAVTPDGYHPAPVTSDSDTDLIASGKTKKKQRYPYSVFFILSNEFCERFSYYGMRAILILYLTQWLSFDENKATSIYHAFSMTCYFMPLLGAVLADGYLGRYWTILGFSTVYFFGSLVLSTTAVPPPESIGPSFGLLLIAMGTGGIKSSVAPFGADQFEAGQEKAQNSFFAAFYFMINLGSTISTLLTPVLRADVQCFGKDCYLLAFGVPAILMLVSILLFFGGSKLYKKVPPTGNVIGKTFMCIIYGVKGKICRLKYEEKREHWLFYADHKYDHKFIGDVRQLLKVFVMFLPLPLFWALNNQQGSRWTLQAEHMQGNMGIFGVLKPDQMQALNPLLILALIPLFEKIVYPLLDKCRVPHKPLQLMVVGLFITALSFVSAGLVQIRIDRAEDPSLGSGETGVTFMNTLNCDVNLQSPFYTSTLRSEQMTEFLQKAPGTYNLKAEALCSKTTTQTFQTNFTFLNEEAYRVILYKEDNDKLAMKQFKDHRVKPKHGNAALSVFSTADPEVQYVTLVKEYSKDKVNTENVGTSISLRRYDTTAFQEVEPGMYSVYVPDLIPNKWKDMGVKLDLGTGGVYTVFISGDSNHIDVITFTDLAENTVSMLWQVPQYVLVTIGEVLFSVSGLCFAYSQAPDTLKSVVQAMWLACTGFGDLIVIIIANIRAIRSQMVEFFIFAVLMLLDAVLFMIMAMFYQYKPNSLYTVLHDDTIKLRTEHEQLDGSNLAPADEPSPGGAPVQSPSNTELMPLHLRKMTVNVPE